MRERYNTKSRRSIIIYKQCSYSVYKHSMSNQSNAPASNNILYFIYMFFRMWCAPFEICFFRLFTNRYGRGSSEKPMSITDSMYTRQRDILGIHTKIPEYSSESDIVLVNHRGVVDAIVCQQGTIGICRGLFSLAMGPLYLFARYDKQIITIQRGKTNRIALYSNICAARKINNLPIVLYPEGTRCRHTELPHDVSKIDLKPGSLKMIYENNMKFQIHIHRDIEYALDERTYRIQHNVKLTTHTSNVYDPKLWKMDGKDFDEFYKDVKELWRDAWYCVYDDTTNGIANDTTNGNVSIIPKNGLFVCVCAIIVIPSIQILIGLICKRFVYY